MSDEKQQQILSKRDAKVHHHLTQYAPVWVINEQVLLELDGVQFEVVFYHPKYAWVSRRYFYDYYNDVLYQKGQIALDEDDAYDIQAQDPFISADIINTVNSYGG